MNDIEMIMFMCVIFSLFSMYSAKFNDILLNVMLLLFAIVIFIAMFEFAEEIYEYMFIIMNYTCSQLSGINSLVPIMLFFHLLGAITTLSSFEFK